MSDKILRALIQLFAILGKKSQDEEDIGSRQTVFLFLKQVLNSEQIEEYLALYDEFLKSFENNGAEEKKIKKTAVSSVKVLVICEQINEALTQRQKIVVLIKLIEIIYSDSEATEQELAFIQTVYSSFNINDDEFDLMYGFVTNKQLIDNENLLVIGAKQAANNLQTRWMMADNMQGELRIIFIKSVGLYFVRYFGVLELNLNGHSISDNRIYQLNTGASIRGSKISSIYYSDIASNFLNAKIVNPLSYSVAQISYNFSDGKKGLHELSFEENSGTLVGIMGGSGAGKSTLLNILNGIDEPTAGQVLINGHNLHTEKKYLEGIIGFVSQDDLLIDDLTVFQNLHFNAELCFNSIEKLDLIEKVNHTLNDLGLLEIKDLKVGSPLDKMISGGQRKRLNIALELIREPSVLFVDEPTSGLSSRDSETIIDLLKELTLKGKLVFVVIHQPSSDIFKVFDKLLILDKGGYPIYMGNPVEAVSHFKKAVNYINPNENECLLCGNVNPEQVFNIIETRVLDENGMPTNKRKVSPKEWNKLFTAAVPHEKNRQEQVKLPVENTFAKPSFLTQLKVFIKRDVVAKMANKQYLAINLIEAPFLAFILSFMTRYQQPNLPYTFADNKNLVSYIFMSVVVALFLGLTVSAEEIFKDRKIRKREEFLNLSKGSYLLSKTIILLVISAIQTALFVIVGNAIIGFHEMNFLYWLMLFAISFFANILGLNISSAFKSAVTIYIIIPFLIIPQLLLSGLLVKFDELNPQLASQSIVPLSGDIMVARWAFEALAVEQFINNSYEKNYYLTEKNIIQASYYKGPWFNKMKELVEQTRANKNSMPNSIIITNELLKVNLSYDGLTSTKSGILNAAQLNKIDELLLKTKQHYNQVYKSETNRLDNYFAAQQNNSATAKQFEALKANYYNNRIADLVKNSMPMSEPIFIENNELHPTENNIYFDANSNTNIRAHFYAPTKYFLNKNYSTYWVNIFVILGMTVVCWIILYFELLQKVMNGFENISKSFKRKRTA